MPWRHEIIRDWGELIELADTTHPQTSPFLPRHLFRGQAAWDWSLESTLLRELRGVPLEDAYKIEAFLMHAFNSEHHLHISQPPARSNEAVELWALMRHYGAPTRILDWSASLFVAAYFAVDSFPNEDGAIWAICPAELTKQFEGPASPSREPVRDLRLKSQSRSVIVQSVDTKTARIAAQQGHITYCPYILSNQEELIGEGCAEPTGYRDLPATKFLIPSTLKPAFMLQLRSMNITASALFPGIDGLGRSLLDAVRLQREMLRDAGLFERGIDDAELSDYMSRTRNSAPTGRST
jgi:hypothetical protein